jgi:hypothetical protein
MSTSALYQPPVNLDLTGNSGSFAWVDGSTPNVDDTGLLTDSIDVSALTNTYLQFWIYSNNVTNPGDNMTLYLNFYDGSAWQDSIWGYAGDGTAWQFVGIDLSAYTISGNVLFEWVVDQTTAGTAFYNDILLDDISVQERPACPFPLGFSASNVTAFTADLSWTAVAGGTTYEVIYGLDGFDPATGGTSQNETTTSASLSSLSGATGYDAYLVATCGANGISDTAGPVSFVTSCVPLTAPYSNNFDSETSGQSPFCWEQYNNYNTLANANVGAIGAPRSGTQQLAIYNYTGFGATDTLISITPEFSDLTGGDKQIRFHAKVSDINSNKLYIYTLSSNTTSATGTLIDSVIFSAANVYEEIILPITTANGYNGTDTYIGFSFGLAGALTFDYIYIDDFFYEVIPTCPKVSNPALDAVTGTSADISFTTTGTAVEYEFGLTGFTQGTNVAGIVSSTANPFTISGLASNTTYDVYVRNDCGGGDVSVWEGPFTFTTGIVPPYLEDFAAGIPSTYGTGRGVISNPTTFTGTGSWFQDGFGNVGTVGAAKLNIYSTFVQDWMFGPAVDLGTGTIDYQLEFDAALTAWNNTSSSTLGTDDTIHVVLSYDDGVTWNRSDAIFTLTANDVIPNTGSHYIVSLAGITGGVRFAFYGASLTSNADNDFFIDNVEIKEVPTCPQPLGVNGTVVSSDSVWLNWNTGSALTLKGFVEYGPTGFAPGSGATGTIATLDTFAGIGGLTGNTTYDIYVYDSCASGFSPLTGPLTLTTLCNALVAPSTETFSTGSVPACWTIASDVGSGWVFSGGAGYGATGVGTPGQFAWVDGSTPVGAMNVLTSPLYDVSPLNIPFLRFEYFSNNTNNPGDNNTFYVNMWDGAQWNDSIWVYRGDDPAWQTAEILLSGYTISGDIQFEFVINENAGTAFYNDILLDSVVVEEAPPCPTPVGLTATNITATSVDINATAVNASSYNIEWGPTGFTQGSGTGTLVTGITTLPHNISGLNPNTFYDVYLQVDCGIDGTSVWIGPINFKTDCLAALAGTYTIGGTAGPTNFATLDSAIAEMNGCGISAPVVFNFAGGSSYEPVIVLNIQGGSSTNTVTFNGNVANPDTIAGFDLIGTDYVTFNDVYFERASGFLVRLSDRADNNTFNGCTFRSDQSSTSSLNSCIAITSSPTSFSGGGNNANNLTVDNCNFIGGYAAVTSYGLATDAQSGLSFTNNVLDNQYNYGIYMFHTDSTEILNNTTIRGLRSTFGYNIFGSYTDGSIVEGNAFYGGAYGVYFVRTNETSTTNRNTRIVNNMLSGTTYSLYLNTSNRVDVYHNTFVGGRGGYFTGAATDYDIRNNIFAGTGSHTFYVNTVPTNLTLDYNAYDTISSPLAYWAGTTYNDLASWNAGVAGYNANSVEGDASLASSTDYHVVGVLPNNIGDNSIGVTVDIDGDARPIAGSTVVDMGADEYTPLNDDVGIEEVITLPGGCGDSNIVVSVVFKNFGLNNVTSVPVTVDVSGGATASLSATYTGSVASGLSDTLLVGSYNTYAGANGVMLSAALNMVADQKSSNDSLMQGPFDFLPFEPIATDVIACVSDDSVSLGAQPLTGIQYGWYASNNVATDTVPLTLGDTATFALASAQSTYYVGYMTNADSLQTTYAGGNGCSGGNMFDVTATSSLSINGFGVNTNDAAGGPSSVSVHYIVNGTYAGNETTPAAWTLHETVSATSAGPGGPTKAIFNNPLVIPAGSTYAIYVEFNAAYTNGNGTNQQFTNNDMVIDLGVGLCSSFGGLNNPRVFNGTIYYGSAGCSDIRTAVNITSTTDTATADFTTTGTQPTFSFDASASTNADSYSWDFGDGSPAGSGVTTSHTYTASGTYTVVLTVNDTTGCASTAQFAEVVNVTIGLEENDLSKSLSVYPNPTNNSTKVSFNAPGNQSAVIRILELSGKEVIRVEENQLNGQYNGELNLAKLSRGVYMLEISSGDLKATRRLIKN